jgi:hypothetical protein
MYGYDVDTTDTKQQRAFNRLMDRSGPRPATHSTLRSERCDGYLQMDWFCKTHDFITNVTYLGDDTYIVEYMS